MKHTQGQWKIITVKPQVSPSGQFEIKTDMRAVACYTTVVAICGRIDQDEQEANAKLIAAAPDLLEALIMVNDADNDNKADGNEGIPALAKARIEAAIKKATA